MSISPELAELAQRVGVATGYVDGTGVARVPSVEVLIAVFRALGIAIDRESDAASLLTRLNTQLDAFGNPFGFMPLLSLASTVRLHERQAERALEMLLLTT